MAQSRNTRIVQAVGFGLVFGVITVAANRLSYPGGAVISLIIGTNFGWMLWPFMVGFFTRLAAGWGAFAGALSTACAVVSYYLVDDLLAQGNPSLASTANAIMIWGIIATVVGSVFGALGAGARGHSWGAGACLAIGGGLIAGERVAGYFRQSGYPYPPAALFDATIVSLVVLAVVVGGMAVWQLQGGSTHSKS